MSWRDTFAALAGALGGGEDGAHTFLALAAEDTDFVRFNHGKVRQAGSVAQGHLDVRRIRGRRHATSRITVTGDVERDLAQMRAAITALDEIVAAVPEDPHLLVDVGGGHSERVEPAALPTAGEAVDAVLQAARHPEPADLVGVWQSGGLHRALASTYGHRHWFTSAGFALDYSLVHDKDRAVKRTFAGTRWDADALAADVDGARVALALLARPARFVPPGRYRAWLSPAAVGEIFDLFGWGDFGARSQQTRSSALLKLAVGEVQLDPRITVAERVAGGLAPGFSDDGFVKPDEVPLIRAGQHAGCFVSPRSAVEFGLEANGADAGESFAALVMDGGDLPDVDVLAALGTGVYVSNLWYLNHSDRNAARFTGMTRFATFWVEDGEIVAPLAVMRFDDSVYDLLGPRLERVGARVAMLPSMNTYGGRSTSSQRVPGVLLNGLSFTL
jgi:predicted Zn-dependent protease